MGHFPSASQLVTFTTNILFKKVGLKSFLGISMSKYIFFSELTKKAVLEEYKEWLNDGVNKHKVLILREDPII